MEANKKDLLAEFELLKHLEAHPNVIRLLGAVTTSGEWSMPWDNFCTPTTIASVNLNLSTRCCLFFLLFFRPSFLPSILLCFH